MRQSILTLIALILIAFSDRTVGAQSPSSPTPTSQPAFEVASVRTVADHNAELQQRGIQPMTWTTFPSDRFFAHSIPLKLLIGLAFGVDEKEHSGRLELARLATVRRRR